MEGGLLRGESLAKLYQKELYPGTGSKDWEKR